MKWHGYILFEHASIINQAAKDYLSSLSCGEGDQCSKIQIITSLDEKKLLVKLHTDSKGSDLISALDILPIDSYIIYGETEYEEGLLPARLKTSQKLAYAWYEPNRLLFEVDP